MNVTMTVYWSGYLAGYMDAASAAPNAILNTAETQATVDRVTEKLEAALLEKEDEA